MSQQARQLIAQAKAKGWTRLDLGNCDLHDLDAQIPELFELTQLEVLILSDTWQEWDEASRQWVEKQSPNKGGKNRLSQLPQGIARLQQLRTLICGGWWRDNWGIADLRPLSGLVQLTKLYLGDNKITDISPLSGLAQLTKLYLFNNQITDLSPLSGLVQLSVLYLSLNQLTDLRPLSGLVQLSELYLSFNQLTDLRPLSGLVQLSELNLSANQLTDLSPLAGLVQLTQLNLSYNQITDLRPLSGLVQLTELYLHNNQLTDLRPLSGLVQLTKLYLVDNKITDIRPLAGLVQLTWLSLNSNQITDIRPLLPLLRREAEPLQLVVKDSYETREGEINIQGNPLQVPPMEIVKRGREAVLRYLERLEQGTNKLLCEAKLLIVGEARVGKTSLLAKIFDSSAALPSDGDTTRGIDVWDYRFEANGESYTIHFWDFGGQQIYRSTHNLFLSARSLYVLVDNSSRDDTRLSYWLQKIDRLAGSETPTLLVQNQRDSRQKPIDENGLWGTFAQLRCAPQPYQFDFACQNSEDRERLEALKKGIEQQIANMPIVQVKLPLSWVQVREQLADWEEKKPYISRSDLHSLCAQYGIHTPQDLRDLSQLFHDLGVFLHFQDNAVLKHLVILQKEWATDAIYAVLDDITIATAKKGRFCKNDLERIWQAADQKQLEKNQKHASYLHFIDELVALMLKFELCYERTDRAGEYIIPQMLPVSAPAYEWGSGNDIQLRYNYGAFMPEGILHRLIVRMHHYISNLDEAWGRGCILYFPDNSTKAEILEPYNKNRITFRAKGSQAKTLLSNIAYELDNINRSYGKEGLHPDKLVPCICDTCIKGVEQPHFYNYDDLLRRKERGRQTIECGKSYNDVNVLRLIDAVFEADVLRHGLPKSRNPQHPPRIFISYAQEDLYHLKELKKHLSPLVRRNAVQEPWHDREILAGSDWNAEIQNKLNTADVVLLLISADYFKNYIWENEMPRIIERHQNKEIVAIPIIVRACIWEEDGWISQLQAVTAIDKKDNSRIPLCSVPKRKQDEAFKNAAQQIMAAIDEFKTKINN